MTMAVDDDHDSSFSGQQQQQEETQPHQQYLQQHDCMIGNQDQFFQSSFSGPPPMDPIHATSAFASAAGQGNQFQNNFMGLDAQLLQAAFQQQQLQQQQQQQQSMMIQQQQQLRQQASNLLLSSASLNNFLQNNPHHNSTHNLIPMHLQASAMPPSLNGTPGYEPALIPSNLLLHTSQGLFSEAILAAAASANANTTAQAAPCPILTVQDRPQVPPVYNGVNPHYPGLRLVHTSPPIFAVDQFLTPLECDFLIHVASDSFGPAPVVGKGSGEISPSRTSSTCYLAREDVPDYMRKVSWLTGKPIEHCELPQVGRYLPSQQYLQHYDAFDLSNEDGRRFCSNGGQRTVTVLVYLNHVEQGGGTFFPALNLQIQPRQGMAIVFFPATIDGYLDKMALHAALPAIDPKFVSQVWIRQGEYKGQPSKRLLQTMGMPLDGTTATPSISSDATMATNSNNNANSNNVSGASMGAPPGFLFSQNYNATNNINNQQQQNSMY